MRSLRSIGLVLFVASGCGGEPSYAGGPIPVESLCAVVLDDLCRALIECYAADYQDLDHCRGDHICRGGENLVAEVAMGWIAYDPNAAELCHEGFEADPCSFGSFFVPPTVQQVLARCEDVATGTQPLGAECASDLDCAEGFCARETRVCGGTCTGFGGEGASCDGFALARCEASLVCREGVCRPPFVPGDPCDETNFTDCFNDGFTCDRDARVCRERAGDGEICHEVDGPDCAVGLVCIGPSFFREGTCRERSGGGGSCGDSLHCQDGFYCQHEVGMLGACAALAAAGAPCMANGDCQADLQCVGGECGPSPGLGDGCTSRCAEGLVCDLGVCKSARYPGDSCDDGSLCVQALCVGGACRTRAPLGASCSADHECASRACASALCVDPASCL